MKTPEQIKAWMEAHPWYEQFEKNVFGSWFYTTKEIDRTLSGENGIKTIVLAFDWQVTNEGFGFWDNINDYFLEWYNEENPD